jgi:hypothetical protein
MKSALTSKGSTWRWREIRARILRRDRNVCQYGGGYATPVDHVLPRWMGGDDRDSNLKSSCEIHQRPENRGVLDCRGGFLGRDSRHAAAVGNTSPHGSLPTLRGERTVSP